MRASRFEGARLFYLLEIAGPAAALLPGIDRKWLSKSGRPRVNECNGDVSPTIPLSRLPTF
jgi:hypothetical protein